MADCFDSLPSWSIHLRHFSALANIFFIRNQKLNKANNGNATIQTECLVPTPTEKKRAKNQFLFSPPLDTCFGRLGNEVENKFIQTRPFITGKSTGKMELIRNEFHFYSSACPLIII